MKRGCILPTLGCLVFWALIFFLVFTTKAAGATEPQIQDERVAAAVRMLVEAAAACEGQAETNPQADADTKPTVRNNQTVEGITHLAGVDQEAVLTLDKPVAPWTEEEAQMLATLAMAEAEGEDTIGKALVIMVVLNRVESDSFPDTIEGVIFDPGQFSPVAPGHRYYTVEPNADCWAALELVESGWDESQGALYFERNTEKDTWHSKNLIKLFSHGGHTFYTEG